MAFLECDLERLIMEAPISLLLERGLEINPIRKNQVKIGNYGICDIIAFKRPVFCPDEIRSSKYSDIYDDEPINIQIFELKQNEIGFDAFHQAIKYVRGLQKYFYSRGAFNFQNIKCEIILIGKTIKVNSDSIYLPNVFNDVYFYTYKYNFDGIYFEIHKNYSLTDEGF